MKILLTTLLFLLASTSSIAAEISVSIDGETYSCSGGETSERNCEIRNICHCNHKVILYLNSYNCDGKILIRDKQMIRASSKNHCLELSQTHPACL